jgi:hypothetical protein
MKTIEFSPRQLFTLKPFRRVALIVCLSWLTRFEVSCVSKVLSIKQSDDNRVFDFMLLLLMLKVITLTILRFSIRRMGIHYNPHRKTALSLAPHTATPQSGFVLGI